MLLLDYQLIFHGGASNVGWYGTLLLVYKIFGFSLFSAHYVRLVLQLISLICLASFLKKTLGEKKAIVPLVTIALSPTVLFFNTLGTPYGVDLQYLPICLYLISTLKFKTSVWEYFKQSLLGGVTMLAWMSYPVFVFYLPALLFYYIYRFRTVQRSNIELLKILISAVLFFLLPLIFFLVYLKNWQALIHDPLLKTGIFRAGGELELTLSTFQTNITGLLTDLFVRGQSYLYEVKQPDFSWIMPIAILILIFSIYLFLKKKFRSVVLVIWLVIMSNLIISSFTFDITFEPGLRRYTPILAGIYGLYSLACNFMTTSNLAKTAKQLWLFGLLILPIHHLIVYPINLSHLKDPSENRHTTFLDVKQTPQQSYEYLISELQHKDLRLKCSNVYSKQVIKCQYMYIYSILKGACRWNNLHCKELYGYDLEAQEYFLIRDRSLIRRRVF